MNHSHHYRIGIFDSGLGGLSVRAALRRQLPDASLLYVADSGQAPYGIKSPDIVRERCHVIADFLLSQHIDALVIACNTATAAAAVSLRASHTLPIIAMDPGLKPAIQASRNGTVAVLATRGTLGSQQFDRLRSKVAGSAKVLDVPCPGWVELVEKGLADSPEAYQLVADTLAPVAAAGADTLVLGCTHFPFLHRAISAFMPNATLIETGEAVAAQTKRRLLDIETSQLPQEQRCWTSGNADGAALLRQLTGEELVFEQLPVRGEGAVRVGASRTGFAPT